MQSLDLITKSWKYFLYITSVLTIGSGLYFIYDQNTTFATISIHWGVVIFFLAHLLGYHPIIKTREEFNFTHVGWLWAVNGIAALFVTFVVTLVPFSEFRFEPIGLVISVTSIIFSLIVCFVHRPLNLRLQEKKKNAIDPEGELIQLSESELELIEERRRKSK